jgi:hypothetical protein
MHYNIGLYSYPKSGNTWLRNVFADIFSVKKEAIPDAHQTSELFPREKRLTLGGNSYSLFKSHFWRNLQNVPDEGESIEIVLVRNPLDVFLSYLNYLSNNVASAAPIPFDSIDELNDSGLLDHYFSCFLIFGQVQPAFFSATNSYFNHARFWLNRAEKHENTHLVKYEDLTSHNFNSIFKANSAIRISSETTARAFENIGRRADGKFYWKMKTYHFDDYLDSGQINLFTETHSDLLKSLGYYDHYAVRSKETQLTNEC